MDEYTRFKKEAAKSALRFIQKDLRHHIGRVDRGVWLRNSPIPTIRCDEGGWVKLDRSLSNELLCTHHEREIGYPLSRTSRTEYNREMQRRLQLLIDGNYINYKSDGKIRLQFLGIRLAPPPDLDDVAEGVPPFSQRMVGSETQFQELQREQDTQHIGQDLLMQNGKWIQAFGPSEQHQDTLSPGRPSWNSTPQSLRCRRHFLS